MLTHRNWAEGLNIYDVTIPALLGTTLVLLEESWRVRLVREIGNELDERQNQSFSPLRGMTYSVRRSYRVLFTTRHHREGGLKVPILMSGEL